MARPSPPYIWARLLRDHGPKDPMVRLTLHTLRTFMNSEGRCFPSQGRIARAAAISEKTVGKSLRTAQLAHWIAMRPRARPGQRWNSYSYRSCIPDSLTIEAASYSEILDRWAEDYGQIESNDLLPQRRTASRARRKNRYSVGTSGTEQRKLTAELTERQVKKDGNDVPTNSVTQTPTLISSHEGAAPVRSTECDRRGTIENCSGLTDEQLGLKVAALLEEGFSRAVILKALSQHASSDRLARLIEREGAIAF